VSDARSFVGQEVVLFLGGLVARVHELEAVEEDLEQVNVFVLDGRLQFVVDNVEERLEAEPGQFELDARASDFPDKVTQRFHLDVLSALYCLLDSVKVFHHFCIINSSNWCSL